MMKKKFSDLFKSNSGTNNKKDDQEKSNSNSNEVSLSFFSKDLRKNVQVVKSIFKDVDILNYRDLETVSTKMCFIYSDGVVSSEIIDEHILKPLMQLETKPSDKKFSEYIKDSVVQVNSSEYVTDMKEIETSLSYGNSMLLIDGEDRALIFDTKSFISRAISEPDGEKILSGPREGFSEVLMQNLSLVRRKLRTSDLKMKYYSMGKRSNTQLCIVYMDSLIKPNVLKELYKRLDKIEIDAILDANYITEMIRDDKWSIFRSTGYTERPDVVAGKLLEGRVAIFVDGTPVVLTVPYLFIENFQSNEDYYLNFYYTSLSRMLRIIGFFLAITVPALYIAIVSYHHEMLPNPLMINIAADSHNVPLPAALEAMLLLIMFDILRETGIRMPLGVGQALSIVGALVVGSAAVEADLVSAPMIIVTAISGITTLLIPKMNSSVIIIRLTFVVVSSVFGFFGLILGLSVMIIHILNLKSFGVSQLTRDNPLSEQKIKDIFVRTPWWNMITRPEGLTNNKTRLHINRSEE